jgi:formylglycine-generating enzyme required for sulfatase activity
MLSIKRCLLMLTIAVGILSTARAQTPAAPALAPPPEKLVLCWYMVCFANSVERYKQEIELAQRHGIDGFLLDVGGWGDANNGYVKASERFFEAAQQLNSGFKLAMAPEYLVSPFEKWVPDMVLKFKDHPNYLKQDGRPVLASYCGHGMLPPALAALEAQGVKVFLVADAGLNSRPRFTYNPSYETFADMFTTPVAPYLDGLMLFNAESLGNHISANAMGRRVTQKFGKLFAAGVMPNYNSANLQDYRGMGGYLDQWQGAMNDGADWISLVIWNDYNEDSALMPGRWPWGAERYLFSRDESYLHATAYASAWFKTGQRPAITQDKLFVTYRNRSMWLRRAWDGDKKQWVDACLNYPGRFDQIHDDNADLVYVDTFLTAPAKLTVRLGGKAQTFALPAGAGRAEVPLVPGTPRLTLERGGKVLAETLGRRQILGAKDLNERNSLVGYHHIFRTWAGGTAIGPVVKRLEAEAGTLGPEATLVAVGTVKAVKPAMEKYDPTAKRLNIKQIMAQNGGSVTLPVEGLATATYNVRVIYRNPGPGEARLAFFADGAGLGNDDFPYFIPLWLPPTDGDKFETASFFFSLYSATRAFKLQMLPGHYFGDAVPADDDYGSALIDAVELVKVEPVVRPKIAPSVLPELVRIPGGKFTMGSDAGEPDEQPRHQVTVSAFAMGKYEVTNAEFERFDPAHRAFRNGNSWRDREPVVHVSWLDGARYCNWLSQQAGLTPVYAEKELSEDTVTKDAKGNEKTNTRKWKQWVADLTADGFRLPTEAEWEYVATGRGEGRTYPWGNDAPVPGVHGRFQLKAALGARLPRPASEDDGAVVVGSYPAGASRDGVMDLAGNVGEWCTDWYAYPYPAGAQPDPCNQAAGNYRAIRGGSWSWYGHSQRAADREFNSQNYPGHAYYGFRVVVSEAGWAKLQNSNRSDRKAPR